MGDSRASNNNKVITIAQAKGPIMKQKDWFSGVDTVGKLG